MGNEKLLFKNKELSKVACATEVKKRVPLLCPLGKECRRREPGSPDVPVEVRGWGGGMQHSLGRDLGLSLFLKA